MNGSDFQDYLAATAAALKKRFPELTEKDINYGHQFIVNTDTGKVTLTVYNGKKGRKLVWSGNAGLKEELQSILSTESVEPAETTNKTMDQDRGVWAGSDESGKGDFFGSLVVAAVAVDEAAARKMIAAGIKDCKQLSDKKILELDKVVREEALDYSVLELLPKFYNLRYSEIKAAGGKLNQLLGSGHINAVSQLLARNQACTSAIIDQFTASPEVVNALRVKFPRCLIVQRPRAETDIAVAAASVLARAQFLRTMDVLAAKAGERSLPRGGGSCATEAAGLLAAKMGKEALKDFVKIHFVNYTRL